MTTRYLSVGEVLAIHRHQTACFGGNGAIRDIDLLKAAVMMPAISPGSERRPEDLFQMAAVYMCRLIKNQPFVSGNNQVGAVAPLAFLILNGYDFQAPEVDFYVLVMGIATGLLEKSEVAVFIQRWSQEIA